MSTPTTTHNSSASEVSGCCPDLSKEVCCDVLDFRYRLPHRVQVENSAGRPTTVTVEVTLHIQISRCPGPLFLGDPIHTITLLPGEKVKLFTADRRTRFTFDSSTNLSYRNEQLSEDRYFMTAMQSSMSDVTATDSRHSSNSESGKWDFHGDASGSIGFLSASADTSAHGSHSGQSTVDFLRELSTHAKASASQSVQATHAAASLSIGEVSTRTHTSGESENQYESSSREFSNHNQCHAVTYYFYRLNRKQIVKVTLEAVERRVEDPAAPTGVSQNPPVSKGQISVVPTNVLATQENRLAVEQIGRDSVAAQARQNLTPVSTASAASLEFATFQPAPLTTAMRQAAIEQVDKDLVAAGLITAVGGAVSSKAQKTFEVISESCLPTPGIIVKGCLDECDTCEPELQRKISLELDKLELENKLLQRQIDLLDKAQEYRCCPSEADSSEE